MQQPGHYRTKTFAAKWAA